MPKQELRRVEELPLRQVFDDETTDFTPWLAENLDLLGEILDLNLTLKETEGEVGSLYVDIVADSDQGLVVIENQLERSNHSHLGQLLSYGAGRKARFLVWVAPEFKDEHRAALEWLNEGMPDAIEFYAVEVRILQIDDSPAAPRFSLVVSPNQWIREYTGGASSSLDGQRYKQFWSPLRERLRDIGISPNTRKSDLSMQSFKTELAVSGILYYLGFAGDSEAEVQFYIDTDDITYNKRLFDELQQHREEIEAAVGTDLRWDRREGNRASMIRARRRGSLDDPPDQLNDVREWMIETLVQLRGAIDPLFLARHDSSEAE